MSPQALESEPGEFVIGMTRSLGYHSPLETSMTLHRFMCIVVATVLGIAGFGCSQGDSPPVPPSDRLVEAEGQEQKKVRKRWWRDQSVLADLELTDDQVQAVNDLMAVKAGDGNSQRERERKLSLRYLRALAQEPYDPAMVDRLSGQLVETLANEQRLRIESTRALRDILTQDQWTKLWEVAPRAVQVGRFRVMRGPTISVTDESSAPSPTPASIPAL